MSNAKLNWRWRIAATWIGFPAGIERRRSPYAVSFYSLKLKPKSREDWDWDWWATWKLVKVKVKVNRASRQ